MATAVIESSPPPNPAGGKTPAASGDGGGGACTLLSVRSGGRGSGGGRALPMRQRWQGWRRTPAAIVLLMLIFFDVLDCHLFMDVVDVYLFMCSLILFVFFDLVERNRAARWIGSIRANMLSHFFLSQEPN